MPIRRIAARMVFVAIFCLLPMRTATAATLIIYDITGWVDTTDDLYITGANLHWEHPYSGSPVGLQGGLEKPTTISSTLNGVLKMNNVDWTGMWTGFSVSKTYTPLTPALPSADGYLATVDKMSGRGSLAITQQPTADNNYTLVVQYKDGFNGAAFLDARITVVPEPTIPFLAIIGSFFMIWRNRPPIKSSQNA